MGENDEIKESHKYVLTFDLNKHVEEKNITGRIGEAGKVFLTNRGIRVSTLY